MTKPPDYSAIIHSDVFGRTLRVLYTIDVIVSFHHIRYRLVPRNRNQPFGSNQLAW